MSAQSASAVLKELKEQVATVAAAIAADAKAQRALSRASEARSKTSTRVSAALEKRDQLAAAADLLAPDWREWPWVREAKFAEKVPSATGSHD